MGAGNPIYQGGKRMLRVRRECEVVDGPALRADQMVVMARVGVKM